MNRFAQIVAWAVFAITLLLALLAGPVCAPAFDLSSLLLPEGVERKGDTYQVNRSALRGYTPEQIRDMKAAAKEHGIKWRIVGDAPKKTRVAAKPERKAAKAKVRKAVKPPKRTAVSRKEPLPTPLPPLAPKREDRLPVEPPPTPQAAPPVASTPPPATEQPTTPKPAQRAPEGKEGYGTLFLRWLRDWWSQ